MNRQTAVRRQTELSENHHYGFHERRLTFALPRKGTAYPSEARDAAMAAGGVNHIKIHFATTVLHCQPVVCRTSVPHYLSTV